MSPSPLFIFLSTSPAFSVGPPPAASVAVAFINVEASSAATAMAEQWDEEAIVTTAKPSCPKAVCINAVCAEIRPFFFPIKIKL